MIDWNSDLGRKAQQHLESEYAIWLTTVDTRLTPQPRPVWFVWDGATILLYSEPSAHKVKQIQEHERVALHFSADAKAEQDVIILLGDAQVDLSAPPAHKHPAYVQKYGEGIAGLSMGEEQFGREYSVAIRVTPTSLRGW